MSDDKPLEVTVTPKNKGGRPRSAPLPAVPTWAAVTQYLWQQAKRKGNSLGDITKACQLLYEVMAKNQVTLLENMTDADLARIASSDNDKAA